MERRETFRKLRMRENFSRAFEGYFQWISKAGKTHTDNSRKKSPKIQAKKAKKMNKICEYGFIKAAFT